MEAIYARTEHGGHRVVPLQGDTSGFRVEWPHGAETYPSARQTIIALVNRSPKPSRDARDPHLTFDRYFRRGRYRAPRPSVDVFELFRPSKGIAIVPPKVELKPSPALTVFEPETPKGIDLDRRAIEVRKIFYAGFGRRVVRMGYDPEDVLQDIYAGLLVRNNGKCPFDATKSSFAHYVHMVCGCILSNYRRRYRRLERNEVFGVPNADRELVDVATADLVSVEAVQEDDVVLTSALESLIALVRSAATEAGLDAAFSVRCINYLREGRRNKEITQITGVTPSMVSKVLRLVRDVARGWDPVGPMAEA